jgi:SAM-dependent methyltransferase
LGKEVLCLASGGGKQSAAFGVLGAHVHVLDLSESMLERDRQVAAHYGFSADIQQGDMRDLSRYPAQSFDLIWQAYSINYIPDPKPVFQEVARVLKTGGSYLLQLHNPYFVGLVENDWNGSGYELRLPYVNGAEMKEPLWEFEDEHGQLVRLRGPRTFRHTLSTVMNELIRLGFILLDLQEEVNADEAAVPGSWDHFTRIAPPWLTIELIFRPDVMNSLLHQQR